MKATHVVFDPGGESVEALYLNGSLHLHGDAYHDKISVAIESFLDGLGFTGAQIEVEKFEVPFEHSHEITVDGGDPPASWPDEGFRYSSHSRRAK